MLLIRDIFLVKVVCVNLFLSVGGAQERQKVPLELRGVVCDVAFGIFADDEHLADVGFGLGVAFEAVFVATLLFAYLLFGSVDSVRWNAGVRKGGRNKPDSTSGAVEAPWTSYGC